MRIEALKYFVKTVECGSISRAAKLMFCSQPTVSNSIKALEDELGYPLLARSPSGVVPTGRGQQVLEDAKVILNYIDSWLQMAASGETEVVDIAYKGLISHTHLMNAVTALSQEHPEIELRLHADTSVLDPNESRNYRIGIVMRVPQHYDSMVSFAALNNLDIASLMEDEFLLYISSESPLATKDEIFLADLAKCRLALPNSPINFPYIDALNSQNCIYTPQLGDEENIMLAVSRGLAMTIRPRLLASNNYYSYLNSGRIVARRITDLPMPNCLYIITPATHRQTPSEAIVISTIKAEFSRRIYHEPLR